MSAKVVTIVPTRSTEGVAFGEAASDIAAECGYDVHVMSAPNRHEVWKASWGSGAVVFDATVETVGGHNYAAADYTLLMSPFIIVVSRSYLPVNFHGHLSPIAPPYPERWSNNRLLDALKPRLEALAPRVPRPIAVRTLPGMLEEFGRAQKQIKHEYSDTFDVFLSYRGTHAGAARQLADDAGRKHAKRVQVMRVDDLSYSDEVLTLQRRWQILRRIYAMLMASHETWVLWSDDYLDSWWTQGELISFAYLADDAHRATLRVHSTEDGAAPNGGQLVPRLTGRQEKTILKRFVLGNLPESLLRIRALFDRSLARILLGLSDDPMFAPSFSRDPMLECLVCRRRLPPSRTLDVDDFLGGGLNSLRAISTAAWERSRDSGELQCPVCGARYRISSGPSRYWWYPVRNGPTGPGGNVLDEAPLRRALLESGQ